MNTKKILALIFAAVALVALILIVVHLDRELPEQIPQPEAPTTSVETTSPPEPGVYPEEEVAAPEEESKEEKPGFWESILSIFSKKEETAPAEESATTAPTEKSESSTNKTETPAPTTPKTEQPTDTPEIETNVQPEGGEILPPEVDVSMGVEKDDTMGDVNIDVEDVPNVINPTEPTEPAESTKPTESAKPTEKPTEPTKPTESTTPTEPTKPTQTPGSTSDPLDENYDITTLTYEAYIAMNGEQQQAVIDAFASPEVFVKWYKAAEAKYKEEHPDIEIGGDGIIDGGNLG